MRFKVDTGLILTCSELIRNSYIVIADIEKYNNTRCELQKGAKSGMGKSLCIHMQCACVVVPTPLIRVIFQYKPCRLRLFEKNAVGEGIYQCENKFGYSGRCCSDNLRQI